MPPLIHSPVVPYLAAFEEDYGPGRMIRIQGTTPSNCERFNINLQCGPNVEPRDDLALHLSVRVSEGYIARNSLEKQQWGQEQGQGYMPIGPGQQFEIIILCEQPGFKIAVNGKHFCEFTHRMPAHRITYLGIDGDVAVALINHELLPAGPPPQAAPPMHGPPQGPTHYGPPPQQFGPGSQGPYGPPVPPGHENDKPSGLESILGETGVAIAAAIGQQAMQRLANNSNKWEYDNAANQPSQVPQHPLGGGYGGQSVGGLGSIGSILTNVLSDAATNKNPPQQGGYPQGGYPQGGQGQGAQDHAGGLGAIGSILSNVLAESSKPHNPAPPQQPGYPSGQDQGGLGALSSILGNVLNDAQSGNRPGNPPPQAPPAQGGYGQQDPRGGQADLGNLLGSFASSFLNPQQPRK